MTADIALSPTPFPVQERRIGSFSVDSVTNAPLQIEVGVEVDLPQEKAFELVFTGLESWAKEITNIDWNNANSSLGTIKPASIRPESAASAANSYSKRSSSLMPRMLMVMSSTSPGLRQSSR